MRFLTVAYLSLGSGTDRNDTVIYRKSKINVKEELCPSTSTKDWGEWQSYAPAAFLVEKDSPMPIE